MGMIQTDDFLIRVTKVCPPGFNFNIGNKVELTILINGSLCNLVSGTECILCIELLTGNGFPVTAYIDGFSVSGTGYIPAILLCHFKPVIRAFPAKVSPDNEKTACIHQNSYSDPGVKGPQVFYYEDSEGGKELALAIQENMNRKLSIARPRVAKENRTYYLLKRSPGVINIVECGFLTNPEEAALLQTEKYQRKVAEAVADGIVTYLKKQKENENN